MNHRLVGYHEGTSFLHRLSGASKLLFLLFLPFVKYNTVSDSKLFLKMYEGNFLRDSSSHFSDI